MGLVDANLLKLALDSTTTSKVWVIRFTAAAGFILSLLAVSAQAGQISLAWNPSTSSSVGGYRVYFGQSSRNYTANLDVGSNTTHTITDLQNGIVYYFAVTAYDTTKTIESGFSNEVRYSTEGVHSLTVGKTGTGVGTVVSAPVGITCGGDCDETYSSGATVTLTATPVSGSTFGGWSGACSGTGNCQVTMNAASTVIATFIGSTTGSPQVAGLTSTGQIYYTTNLSTWAKIPGQVSQLQVGDLDGDGKADLAGLTSTGQIYYTTNLSDWIHIPGMLAQLVVGDFNGDGWDDLGGLTSTGQIYYTTNLSDWIHIPGMLAQLVVGDFNGDGWDDIAGVASDGTVWYTTDRTTWINVPGRLNRLVAGDFNGDGWDDIAGVASDGTVWYTTDRATWTHIPGHLDRLAGDTE